MPLECSCLEPDNPDSWYYPPDNYAKYPFKRGRKCNCGEMVRNNDTCIIFKVCRIPTGFEVNRGIKYESAEVEESPIIRCESCADLYFSFEGMGFCVSPYDVMPEILIKYHELKRTNTLPDCMKP